LADSKKFDVPAPGTYEQNASPTKKNAPSYGMGLKLKGDMASREGVPGPGTHQPDSNKTRIAAPRFGFGTSKRPTAPNSPTPGPGAYKIPVKVADVTDFNMTGGKQIPDFKFV